MKILKLSETEIFEVIEQEMAENAATYTLKVNRYLSERHPNLAFKDETFFIFPIGIVSKAEELTDLEFVTEIQDSAKTYWNKVADIELARNGDSFVLPSGAGAARSAYAKTHGITNQAFVQTIYGPILEAKKALSV